MVCPPSGRKSENLCRHWGTGLRLSTMEALTLELGLGTCWPRDPAQQTWLCILEGKRCERHPGPHARGLG